MKKLILGLSIIALVSCSKEEDVKPEPRLKTQTTATMAANEEFIGNWIDGKLCGIWTNVHITEGRNDTLVVVYGIVECKIEDGKFSGKAGNVTHEGEIVNGRLIYCQKVGSTSCCGTFTKE